MWDAILAIALIVLYFLPSLVGNKKRASGGIFVLNFFLGWTLIGWVIALVWAATPDPKPFVDPRKQPY